MLTVHDVFISFDILPEAALLFSSRFHVGRRGLDSRELVLICVFRNREPPGRKIFRSRLYQTEML